MNAPWTSIFFVIETKLDISFSWKLRFWKTNAKFSFTEKMWNSRKQKIWGRLIILHESKHSYKLFFQFPDGIKVLQVNETKQNIHSTKTFPKCPVCRFKSFLALPAIVSSCLVLISPRMMTNCLEFAILFHCPISSNIVSLYVCKSFLHLSYKYEQFI